MDNLIFNILTIPYHPSYCKQIVAILKTLTKKQDYKIRNFTKKILNGKLPLNDAQYRRLCKHKFFIRNLAGEKFKKFKLGNIMRNYKVFGEIIDLMLKFSDNESYTKNDTHTFRGMGKKPTKRYISYEGKKICEHLSEGKNQKSNNYTSEENFSESESFSESSSEEEEMEAEETNSDKSSDCNERSEEEEEKEDINKRERE